MDWDRLAAEWCLNISSEEFAARLDETDELRGLRDSFCFPEAPAGSNRTEALYLCGNSLGLQPKGLRAAVEQQLEKWAKTGVEGHFLDPCPWVSIDEIVQESMANLVGAQKEEVVVMNSLTVNLHLMMASFYRPTADRYKIVIEKKAFPSDMHAVTSQTRMFGFEDGVIEISPREGETILRTDDIIRELQTHGASIALVLLSGVQYYTGQWFDIPTITSVAHEMGCKVGWDLAHAVGNVPLELHNWGVDFACWCTYKYLNCGPGSIGGAFVHATTPQDTLRLQGWWGHRLTDRFVMSPEFIPEIGANAWRLSNPSVLLCVCVRASLDLFERAGGMSPLRAKSLRLTGYLENLLKLEIGSRVTIFTPSDPSQRGCQLSLAFNMDVESVFSSLNAAGVIVDTRKPNVMRVAPAPLYNSFTDVLQFVQILKAVLKPSEPLSSGSA